MRDQYGVPLTLANAQIIFSVEGTNDVQITGSIVPNLEPGVNYRLSLPMDSGIAPDLYKPTALMPTVPFRIRVKIGSTTYLPMEMSVNYANLGKPAQSTRIDLTLGVDANGDGLPDAWQQLLLAMLGPSALIGPNAGRIIQHLVQHPAVRHLGRSPRQASYETIRAPFAAIHNCRLTRRALGGFG